MATHRPKILQQVKGAGVLQASLGAYSAAYRSGWHIFPGGSTYVPVSVAPDGTAKKGDWAFDALGPDPQSGIFFVYLVPS